MTKSIFSQIVKKSQITNNLKIWVNKSKDTFKIILIYSFGSETFLAVPRDQFAQTTVQSLNKLIEETLEKSFLHTLPKAHMYILTIITVIASLLVCYTSWSNNHRIRCVFCLNGHLVFEHDKASSSDSISDGVYIKKTFNYLSLLVYNTSSLTH